MFIQEGEARAAERTPADLCRSVRWSFGRILGMNYCVGQSERYFAGENIPPHPPVTHEAMYWMMKGRRAISLIKEVSYPCERIRLDQSEQQQSPSAVDDADQGQDKRNRSTDKMKTSRRTIGVLTEVKRIKRPEIFVFDWLCHVDLRLTAKGLSYARTGTTGAEMKRTDSRSTFWIVQFSGRFNRQDPSSFLIKPRSSSDTRYLR